VALKVKWPASGLDLASWLRRARTDARSGMAAVQLAAVAISLGLLALSEPALTPGTVQLWLVIVIGLALLRVLTAGASLATSTLLLEPLGIVVLLSGTGGAASPFLPMALAGIWWAANASRGEPSRAYRISRGPAGLRLERGQEVMVDARRPISLLYGISMAVSYGVLLAPTALRDGLAAEALEDAAALGATWLLAEVAVQRRQLSPTPQILDTATPAAPRWPRSPQLGISAEDAHFLGYLALDLSNRQIAETMRMPESTVRYRLSRLYRALRVHGRHEAVARARDLNMALPVETRATDS
jgi:hypothetical protein